MSEEIRADEWMAELEAAMQRGGDDGATIRELMEATGHGEHWVKERLRSLQAQGRLIAGRANRPAIDGTLRRVPVYQIREKGNA